MAEIPLARYTFRRSVLEKERSYSLYGDRLVVEGPELAPQTIALRDVRAVHLKYERTKQRGYYQCFIRTRSGRIALRHLHWESMGQFTDRRATYTPFVKALLRQVANVPGVQFKAGSLTNFIGAIVGAPAMAFLGIVALNLGKPGMAVFAGFMMILCLVMLLPSQPRRLDPLAPPEDLLPT